MEALSKVKIVNEQPRRLPNVKVDRFEIRGAMADEEKGFEEGRTLEYDWFGMTAKRNWSKRKERVKELSTSKTHRTRTGLELPEDEKDRWRKQLWRRLTADNHDLKHWNGPIFKKLLVNLAEKIHGNREYIIPRRLKVFIATEIFKYYDRDLDGTEKRMP